MPRALPGIFSRATVLALAACAHACLAAEELITSAQQADGEVVPYVLTTDGPAPRYVLILFPGGSGRMDPRMEDGRLVYSARASFLIRSRPLIVDEEFATAATNSTHSPERIQAVLDDLARRFPQAPIYVAGTSNGTSATMALAPYLSTRIAGEIHTSSASEVYRFDPKRYRNRHLIVHHKRDGCRATPFFAAEHAHEAYGADFIAMDGGVSRGDPCEAFSHHGFAGIERETVEAIKRWVRQGGAQLRF